MRNVRVMAAATTVLGLGLASPASAATVAYYRFEEQPTNGEFLDGVMGDLNQPYDLALDSSGNANHMRTFNAPATPQNNFDTSPRYVGGLTATVPLTGAANNYAFNFGAGSGGDNLNNDDIFINPNPPTNSLNRDFDNGSSFTIEAYVRADTADLYRTFIGRDDFDDTAGANGPLGLVYFQRTGDTGFAGRIKFEAEDKSGNFQRVYALDVMVPGILYHVAAVGDGTTLSLYVDGVLQGATPFSGLLDTGDANPQGWTIGRGFFNGPNDFWDGQIDEVRFSDTALSPSEFLNAVPEPASLSAIALAGLVALRRRRA